MINPSPFKLLPGGVNSPVRSFAGVNQNPIYISRGSGPWLTTDKNKKLLDYVHGWGSIITGHAHPQVIQAIAKQSAKGIGYGLTTQLEGKFAQVVTSRSGMQMVRTVCSGTESCMTAIRLARGYTNRDLIIKFAGCYHGHVDSLLTAAGSGNLTFAKPSSVGVPKTVTKSTIVLTYNSIQEVKECFKKYGNKIAAVILEPIAGNMNLVCPSNKFIQTLAQQCKHYGALLISDEVMTGFRVCKGLAIRDVFGVEPDLACLGKVIGGGLPVAAVAGKKKIMQQLSPTGPVYQAGTLSGNPICLAAGLATFKLLNDAAYKRLERATKSFCSVIEQEAKNNNLELSARYFGGMFGVYLSNTYPTTLAEVQATSPQMFNKLHKAFMDNGILLPPSKFEACFVGLQHATTKTNQFIKKAIPKALQSLT